MDNIKLIGWLAGEGESNNDPCAIADSDGDLGGKSYGAFQFNSRDGIVDDFVNWAKGYGGPLANYGKVLSVYTIGSRSFDEKWVELGRIDRDGFYKLQNDFAVLRYYEPCVDVLRRKLGLDLNARSFALRQVAMSRSVQYSTYWIPELFKKGFEFAIHNYPGVIAESVAALPDYYLISGIYDFLLQDIFQATKGNDGLWHSPDDWANGSRSIMDGLQARFIREKLTAFEILNKEYKK